MAAYNASESGAERESLGYMGEADPAALHLLESNVDFMTLLYGHVVACPPHGPFLYYAALTLVERARRRYTAAAASAENGSSRDGFVSDAGPFSSPAADYPGVYPMDVDGAAAVLRALTIPNVLALMESRYDTRHLASWPLLYVPAEIRGVDVAALIKQQQQR